jgi:hypothetical protein
MRRIGAVGTPLPACGERSDGIEDDIRVRGTRSEFECVERGGGGRPRAAPAAGATASGER